VLAGEQGQDPIGFSVIQPPQNDGIGGIRWHCP
jgi:hypothetical protein